MNARLFTLPACLLGLVAGCAIHQPPQPPSIDSDLTKVSLSILPPIAHFNYTVDPYIGAAIRLQAAGKESGCNKLLELAESCTNRVGFEKIAVLCRMLFVARSGAEFNRPQLGGPSFLSEPLFYSITLDSPSFKLWSLEPIELVDGIPFVVVEGYSYQGTWDPETPKKYVRYCMENCGRSTFHFVQKNRREKEAALKKLIVSPKWHSKLDSRECDYLRKQLE
jgi:hypothetical protein